jgi:hypothetical protein
MRLSSQYEESRSSLYYEENSMKTNSRYFSHVFIALALLVMVFRLFAASPAQAGSLASSSLLGIPPFSGTIFIDPDIITGSDPTTFLSAVYAGQGLRLMFDRRVNAFITVNAYLFNASFSDGLAAEIQVNPEFGSSAAALAEAQKYAPVIGRLPTALRLDIKNVWIHKGTELFGGGNNSLLIHTGQADLYMADGILEETFVHEAAHTSLDAAHASAPGWLAAQAADDNFISTYAQENPLREDIAESILPYLAVKYKSDRISQSLADTILQTIPNRIAYFDNQAFNWYPMLSFADVPSNYWSRDYIERLYAAGITSGCTTNPLSYCPETTVTRAQMAVFLERGMQGASYVPPAVGGSTSFADVPVDYWSGAWIKQLAADGITGGCGSGNYCPENPVTRAQMAVFLLKAKYGAGYTPPAVGASTGFTDVGNLYWAAAWIKQLAAEGITGGCGANLYCPEAPVNRAQMAVFLVKTFNLP